MGRTYALVLPDEELLEQLRMKATVIFEGSSISLRDVERQVERLGFGDSYVVAITQKPGSIDSRVTLKPEIYSAAR